MLANSARRYRCLPPPMILLLTVLAMTACTASRPSAVRVLHIYPDGHMQMGGRLVDPDNVVIYPDGFGGEKAALKMRVPLHPDYYRDTIIVERLPQSTVTRD